MLSFVVVKFCENVSRHWT